MRNDKELVNKKARLNYEISDQFEAGIVLTGAETKSLRAGRGGLNEAFVKIRDGEVWLFNLQIPAFQSNLKDYDPARVRKLLLNKNEILSLAKKTDKKNSALVALKIYVKGKRYKALIGVGKGKRSYEKKEALKKKDQQRELRRDFKESQLH
jgi:SsrA-binding protein